MEYWLLIALGLVGAWYLITSVKYEHIFLSKELEQEPLPDKIFVED